MGTTDTTKGAEMSSDGLVFDGERPGGMGGSQRRYKFANGYGASVVRGPYTYGAEAGLYELAVLGLDGHLCYTTPVTDDVLGSLSAAEVNETLAKIAALPVPS